MEFLNFSKKAWRSRRGTSINESFHQFLRKRLTQNAGTALAHALYLDACFAWNTLTDPLKGRGGFNPVAIGALFESHKLSSVGPPGRAPISVPQSVVISYGVRPRVTQEGFRSLAAKESKALEDGDDAKDSDEAKREKNQDHKDLYAYVYSDDMLYQLAQSMLSGLEQRNAERNTPKRKRALCAINFSPGGLDSNAKELLTTLWEKKDEWGAKNSAELKQTLLTKYEAARLVYDVAGNGPRPQAVTEVAISKWMQQASKRDSFASRDVAGASVSDLKKRRTGGTAASGPEPAQGSAQMVGTDTKKTEGQSNVSKKARPAGAARDKSDSTRSKKPKASGTKKRAGKIERIRKQMRKVKKKKKVKHVEEMAPLGAIMDEGDDGNLEGDDGATLTLGSAPGTASSYRVAPSSSLGGSKSSSSSSSSSAKAVQNNRGQASSSSLAGATSSSSTSFPNSAAGLSSVACSSSSRGLAVPGAGGADGSQSSSSSSEVESSCSESSGSDSESESETLANKIYLPVDKKSENFKHQEAAANAVAKRLRSKSKRSKGKFWACAICNYPRSGPTHPKHPVCKRAFFCPWKKETLETFKNMTEEQAAAYAAELPCPKCREIGAGCVALREGGKEWWCKTKSSSSLEDARAEFEKRKMPRVRHAQKIAQTRKSMKTKTAAVGKNNLGDQGDDS